MVVSDKSRAVTNLDLVSQSELLLDTLVLRQDGVHCQGLRCHEV